MLSKASSPAPSENIAIDVWQPGSTPDSLPEQEAKPAALATAEHNHWPHITRESE